MTFHFRINEKNVYNCYDLNAFNKEKKLRTKLKLYVIIVFAFQILI